MSDAMPQAGRVKPQTGAGLEVACKYVCMCVSTPVVLAARVETPFACASG